MIVDGMIILKNNLEATFFKMMDYSGCLLMNSKKLSVPFQLQCFPEMLNLGKFQELNNKNKITFCKLVLRIQFSKK
jgi:hypothetical protein